MRPIWIRTPDGVHREEFPSADEVLRRLQGRPTTRLSLDGITFVKFKKLDRRMLHRHFDGGQQSAPAPDSSEGAPSLPNEEQDRAGVAVATQPTAVPKPPDRRSEPSGVASRQPQLPAHAVNLAQFEERISTAIGPVIGTVADLKRDLEALKQQLSVVQQSSTPDVFQQRVNEFIEVCQTKLERITRMRDKLEQAHDDFIATVDSYQPGRVHVLEQERDQLKTLVTRKDADVAQLTRTVDDLERRLHKLTLTPEYQDLKVVEQKLKNYGELQGRLALRDENQRLLAQIREYEEREAIYQTLKQEQMRDEEARQDNRALRAEIAAIRQDLAGLSHERDVLEQQRASWVQTRRSYAQRLQVVQEERDELNERIESANSTQEQLATELESYRRLEQELKEGRRELARKQVEFRMRQLAEAQDLQDRFKVQSEREAKALRSEYDARKDTIDRELRSEYEGELSRLQAEIQRSRTQAERLDTELKDTHSALGGR